MCMSVYVYESSLNFSLNTLSFLYHYQILLFQLRLLAAPVAVMTLCHIHAAVHSMVYQWEEHAVMISVHVKMDGYQPTIRNFA